MIQMTIEMRTKVLDMINNDITMSCSRIFDIQLGNIKIKDLFYEDVKDLFVSIHLKNKDMFIDTLSKLIKTNLSVVDIKKLKDLIFAVLDFYDKNDFDDIEKVVITVNVQDMFMLDALDAEKLITKI